MKKPSVAKFSSFLNIEMGQSPESKFVNQESNGVPLLNGPAEFTERYPIPVQYTTEANRFAEKGDILFCVRGSTTGRMNVADQKYAIGRGLAAISHKKNRELNSFVIGLIETNLKSLLGGTLGSVFPNLTKDQLFDFKCTIPDSNTQSQIAAVLSALDDKIELNSRINSELEQMARMLYDYWFVQFDFPDKHGKPYKSSRGKMVYNEILKREIPEGWSNSTVGDIANLVRGVSYSKDQIRESINEDTIRILRATNISGNKIDLNNPILVPRDLVNDDQILNEFDILMTMSSGSIDHIGKNGLFLFNEKVSFGAFCAKLVPNKKFRYYLYLYMQSTYLNTLIKNECLGTNINNLNSTLVKSFKLVKPESAIVEMFNNLMIIIYPKIKNNILQNQQLTSLRDWLLPMLMNGQVKVSQKV